MKIVVCIKVVPDTSVLAFDLDARAFDEDDFVYMVNPLDMVALEAALVVREEVGGEVTCVSVAHPSMVRHLRSCLAMGADSAAVVWDDCLSDADGIAIAKILATAAKNIGFDLVLCGMESDDDRAGVTGPAMAATLDIPHINAIAKLEIEDGVNKAVVHRALERGRREILECALPALFTVHQTLARPRRADFPLSLASLEKEVPVWGLDDLGLDPVEVEERGSRTRITGLALPRPRPKVALRVDGGLSAQKRMKLLMTGGVKQRDAKILEGDAKDLARKVLGIIENHKEQPGTGKVPD